LLEVASDVTDATIAGFLTARLDDINARRDDVIAACAEGKQLRVTNKLKAAIATVKLFVNRVKLGAKKGKIPADVAASLQDGAGRVRAILDGLLANGACS
jgi:hypothetical protein